MSVRVFFDFFLFLYNWVLDVRIMSVFWFYFILSFFCLSSYLFQGFLQLEL